MAQSSNQSATNGFLPQDTFSDSQAPLSNRGNLRLYELIRQRIAIHADQRITFADFMEQALYNPDYGYYNHRARQIGHRGDFFTAPHLGADFGQLLAEQFVQMWHILGQPAPFTLVEMGAGQGLLATDILQWIRQHHTQCWQHLNYVIVEKSPDLVNIQRQQITSQLNDSLPVTWTTLEQLGSEPIIGCFFSNELIDAFAVHQVIFKQSQLYEVYVGVQDQQLVEILAPPSTPNLAAYFQSLNIHPSGPTYPDPYRTEVNLAARDWFQSVNTALKQGYILTIDYGYPAARYYSPVRSQGTLKCYYEHRHHDDPYVNVGEQDITSHVNFTDIEQLGLAANFVTLGLTKQAMFLMALGLGDRLAALGRSNSTEPATIAAHLQRHDALHQLINPLGLGDFSVLVQAKNLTSTMQRQTLKGLDMPV